MLLAPSLAISAPSITGISGTITHGSAITISGSSFGTKSTAAPLIWDDFETGSGTIDSGDSAVVGTWDAEAEGYRAAYSTDYARTGTKAAKCIMNAEGLGHSQRLRKDFTIGTIYLDFWLRVNYVDNKSRNWKTWILYKTDGTLQYNWVYWCNASALTQYDSGGLNTNAWSDLDYSDNAGWMHFSLAFKESSPNTADGYVYHYIDSQEAGHASSAVLTRVRDVHYDFVTIGELWQNDAQGDCLANNGAYVYIDDIYIDSSLSRVMIGNASTWSACTHMEIQVPTAWSASSVTATVNRGSFGATDSAYLYVVDADGAVNSSGYEITFGDTEAGSPAPPTLSNVTISNGSFR